MRKSIFALIIILFNVVACQGELGPEDIVSQSMKAINEGNVDEAMSFYADGAEVNFLPAVPPGSPETYQGREELVSMLEAMVSGNTLTEFEIQASPGKLIIGNGKISSDRTRELGLDPLEYEESYTVRDGKIASATYVLKEDSLVNYMTAIAPEPDAILGSWVMVDCCYLQFNADDTYQMASRLSDLDSNSDDSGTFSVEGSSLIFASGEATRDCQTGDEGYHQFTITEDDLWALTLDEQCDSREGPSNFMHLTKIDNDS
jgi:hypothetical protein